MLPAYDGVGRYMSFKTYRIIDLTIWLVIMLVAEVLTSLAANKWFPLDSFAVSLTFPVLMVVYMRWGGAATVNAVVGGIATCLFSQITGGQAMTVERVTISLVGHLSLTSALIVFLAFGKGDMKTGKKVIRDKWYLSLLYVTAMYLVFAVCCAAVDAIFTNGNFFHKAAGYITFHLLTLAFAYIVVIVVIKPEGLFEDQQSYLVRLEKERADARERANRQ